MRCTECDEPLDQHTLDVSFQLPDAIWELEAGERATRAKCGPDLCMLDEQRHYIRGVVEIPIEETEETFNWGLWVEVSAADFARYSNDLFDRDASDEPPAHGTLANDVDPSDDLSQQRVSVRFGPSDRRPLLLLEPSDTRLYREQTNGVSLARVHEIIEPQEDHDHAFDSWPFEDDVSLGVITTVPVVEEDHPILLVTHDDDGDWQILCGTTNDPDDARIVCFGCMLDRDASLAELADLPRGHRAWRDRAGDPWERAARE